MIKACFALLTILMAVLVYAGLAAAAGKTITDTQKLRKFRTTTLLVLVLWLVYVSIASLAGVFATLALPPRVPLLLILPCFAFFIWFVRSGRFDAIIRTIPVNWLVYAQSFRIVVELMLHALFLQGILPKAGTFEGYNYEIVIGIAALPMGYLSAAKKVLPRAALLVWNWLGLTTLAVVVFIFISHVYFPGIYNNPEPLAIENFGAFPYTLLAGFLMPLAVFMHVLCLVKLKSPAPRRGVNNLATD